MKNLHWLVYIGLIQQILFAQSYDELSIDFKNDVLDNDSKEVDSLISERTVARENRNFARADEIRDILQKMGIVIKDTPEGTIWRKKV